MDILPFYSAYLLAHIPQNSLVVATMEQLLDILPEGDVEIKDG